MTNRKRPHRALDTAAVRAVAGLAPEVRLGKKQMHLLALLVTHADRAVPHGVLLQEVWGPQYDHACMYLLHMLVKRLRRTLGDAAAGRIVAVAGCGYRWVAAGAGMDGQDGTTGGSGA